MKLNKHGWGYKPFLIYMCILVIALVIATALIYSIYKREYVPLLEDDLFKYNENYNELEYNARNGAIRYIKKYYSNNPDGTFIVKIKSLVNNGIIDELIDIKDKKSVCSGYVEVSLEDTNYKSVPYLKCESYTTEGYDSSKDSAK